MGYTHYWYLSKDIKSISENCLRDLDFVTTKYNFLIQLESDNPSKIVLNTQEIRFNGKGKDGHETFLIEFPVKEGGFGQSDKKGFLFSCCKTAEKPYDLVVCEILLILKAELKDKMRFDSDGFSNTICAFDGNWSKAIEEVKQLGYKIDCCVKSMDNGDLPYYDCQINAVTKK